MDNIINNSINNKKEEQVMEKESKVVGTKEITIEEAKEIATEIFQKYIVENNLSYDSVTILNMCLRQNIGNSTIVEMKY